jgi:hypothetical protein
MWSWVTLGLRFYTLMEVSLTLSSEEEEFEELEDEDETE